MKHLEALKAEDAAQVREYIKQNQSEDFFRDAFDHRETYVPLMIKAKMLPDALVNLFKTEEDCNFLLDQCVSLSYTPSLSFLESFKSFGDQSLLKVINAYPKMPWTMQFLMEQINLENFLSAYALMKTRDDLRKTEIYALLFRNGFYNEEFLKEIISDEAKLFLLEESIDKEIKSGGHYGKKVGSKIPQEIVDQYFIACESCSMDIRSVIRMIHSTEALKAALSKIQTTQSYYSSYGNDMEYEDSFEEIEPYLFSKHSLKLLNVPQGSIHRESFLINNPGKSTDAEILKLVKETPVKKGKGTYWAENLYEKILSKALERSLDIVRQIPIEKIEGIFGPKTIADMTDADDVRLYLLENLSGKYQEALRASVKDKSLLPAKDNSRKKSFFAEAYKGLTDDSVETFRAAFSATYTFSKFLDDTNQATKKADCQKYLADEFVKDLTHDEFMSLMVKTPFMFGSRYRYRDEEKANVFDRKFSLEDCVILYEVKKMSASELFGIVDNKLNFLKLEILSTEDLLSIQSSYEKVLYEDTDLLKVFIGRLQKEKHNSFNLSEIEPMAKVLTAQELRDIVSSVDYWDRRRLVLLKGVDGEYFVTDAQLKETLSDQSTFESEDFIKNLIERDQSLAVDLLTAYGKGNKAMSELLGKEIKIRRGNKEKFNKLLLEITSSTEELVEKGFNEKGGKFEWFSANIFDWKDALIKFGKGRTVTMEVMSHVESKKFLEITQVFWEVKTLSFGNWYSELDQIVLKATNFNVQNIILNDSMMEKKWSAQVIKKFSEANLDVSNLKASNQIELIKKNLLKGDGLRSAEQALANGNWKKETMKLSHLQFIEDKILFDKETIEFLIKKYAGEMDVIQWLAAKVADVNLVLEESNNLRIMADSRLLKVLEKMGVKVLNDKDFKWHQITTKLQNEGKNFAEVDLTAFSISDKTRLIKFIESEIDPSYKNLGLLGLNLEDVDSLYSYSTMKALYSLEDSDLIQIFSIPQGVLSNKKIMKGLRDLISLSGATLSMKVSVLKDIVSALNPKVEFQLSDFVDYSNQVDQVMSETLSNISMESLNLLENSLAAIKESKLLLFNKDKAHILRFMRSASENESHLRDSIEMIKAIINGIQAIKDRIAAMEQEPEFLNEEAVAVRRVNDLRQSISGIDERLAEVAAMDDLDHMHDRLMVLAKFLKEDALQPLGQDKYSRLEKDKDMEKGLGHKVFFPKTRGDLQYLGERNGWCVSYVTSYGDNVIKNGNVLVGICAKDSETNSKENVVALAHFVRQAKGDYYLEQLRWSTRIKGSQEDAKQDFKYGIIMEAVKELVKAREEEILKGEG